ncbi:MAG: hypothetical protein ACKOX3_04970 [Bacteroidota bacterium]
MLIIQRCRHFILLTLLLWGMIGGVVSIHRCMDLTSKSEPLKAVSCCCDNNHPANNFVNKGGCCKSITSYIGIPFYFVVNKPFLFSSDDFKLFFLPIDKCYLNQVYIFEKSIRPPPEIIAVAEWDKYIKVLRI